MRGVIKRTRNSRRKRLPDSMCNASLKLNGICEMQTQKTQLVCHNCVLRRRCFLANKCAVPFVPKAALLATLLWGEKEEEEEETTVLPDPGSKYLELRRWMRAFPTPNAGH